MPFDPLPNQAVPGDVAAIVAPQDLTVQDTLFVADGRTGKTHD